MICTMCGLDIDPLTCVEHANEHLRTLVQIDCRVTYDIATDSEHTKITISYHPLTVGLPELK